jgi:hypothetical protein
MDIIASLSDEQRSSVESYRAVTGTEDLDAAINALSAAQWDVQVRLRAC